jgi:multidrug efflux pump subunit AcrB
VPQVYADVDRDKALKLGVPLADVYGTSQALMGGVYVNDFNRFGRVDRSSCRPSRSSAPCAEESLGLFFVRSATAVSWSRSTRS